MTGAHHTTARTLIVGYLSDALDLHVLLCFTRQQHPFIQETLNIYTVSTITHLSPITLHGLMLAVVENLVGGVNLINAAKRTCYSP